MNRHGFQASRHRKGRSTPWDIKYIYIGIPRRWGALISCRSFNISDKAAAGFGIQPWGFWYHVNLVSHRSLNAWWGGIDALIWMKSMPKVAFSRCLIFISFTMLRMLKISCTSINVVRSFPSHENCANHIAGLLFLFPFNDLIIRTCTKTTFSL